MENDESVIKDNNFIKYKKVGIFGSKNVGKKTFCNFLYKLKKKVEVINDDLSKSSFVVDDSSIFYESFQFVYNSNNYYINLVKLDLDMNNKEICYETYLYSIQIIILVLDITNLNSFEDIEKFLEINKNNIKNDMKIYLISNKSDLQSEKSVSDFDIKKITNIYKNFICFDCCFSELENKLEKKNKEFFDDFLNVLNSPSLIYIHNPINLANSTYSDNKLKLILIGDSTVGKSSFIRKFFENKFFFSFISTIGIDNQKTLIKINDKIIKLEVWDTAGQERLKSLSKKIYSKGDGFLLLFDLTNENSFKNLKENWLNEIEKENGLNIKDSNKKICIYIIGNKFDLTKERTISYEEAKNFCDENNCKYAEMSCFTGLNVYEILCNIAIDSYKINKKNDIGFSLDDNKKVLINKKKKKCC